MYYTDASVGLEEIYQDLEEIEQNLEIIIAMISKVSLDELPREDQHHTIGVPGRIKHLLFQIS